jgi:hypothetical protein
MKAKLEFDIYDEKISRTGTMVVMSDNYYCCGQEAMAMMFDGVDGDYGVMFTMDKDNIELLRDSLSTILKDFK